MSVLNVLLYDVTSNNCLIKVPVVAFDQIFWLLFYLQSMFLTVYSVILFHETRLDYIKYICRHKVHCLYNFYPINSE